MRLLRGLRRGVTKERLNTAIRRQIKHCCWRKTRSSEGLRHFYALAHFGVVMDQACCLLNWVVQIRPLLIITGFGISLCNEIPIQIFSKKHLTHNLIHPWLAKWPASVWRVEFSPEVHHWSSLSRRGLIGDTSWAQGDALTPDWVCTRIVVFANMKLMWFHFSFLFLHITITEVFLFLSSSIFFFFSVHTGNV